MSLSDFSDNRCISVGLVHQYAHVMKYDFRSEQVQNVNIELVCFYLRERERETLSGRDVLCDSLCPTERTAVSARLRFRDTTARRHF